MSKCMQHDPGFERVATCGAPATHRVYWPGREPLDMCERHARRALTVADTMGFALVVNEIAPKVTA